MINANVCKEWQRLLTTRQLKDGRLHMGGCGVEGTHFKTLRIGGLSGMNRARIDENHPAGWCEMLCAFMNTLLEQGQMTPVRQFVCLVRMLYHSQALVVLQNIALFRVAPQLMRNPICDEEYETFS